MERLGKLGMDLNLEKGAGKRIDLELDLEKKCVFRSRSRLEKNY